MFRKMCCEKAFRIQMGLFILVFFFMPTFATKDNIAD